MKDKELRVALRDIGVIDDCYYPEGRKLWEEEKKGEITVDVPTGLYEKVLRSPFGRKTEIVKEAGEPSFGLGVTIDYDDHKIQIPIKDAIEKIIDHLGLQIEYTPEQPEKIGKVYKPRRKK